MENPLLDLLKKLRSCTNRAPVDRVRKSDPTKWARLCTCLDTLTDAQCAINAYRDIEIDAEKAELYLHTYGVLQAMILQQDALANVAGVFEMNADPKKNSCIKAIRDIRNKIAGHPTEMYTKEKGVHTYHRIVQYTLSPVGFEAVEYSHDKEPVREFINLSKVTLQNEQILSNFLLEILEHIEKGWSDHASQYNSTKLAQIFSKEMIEELGEIELNMQDESGGIERLNPYIDAITSGKMEIISELERRGSDRDNASAMWWYIDHLELVVHIIQTRLGTPQREALVNFKSETSAWIEVLCSELQDICCKIGDSSSLSEVSVNRITFMRSQDIPKLSAAVDEHQPIEFTLAIVKSIKSAILDVELGESTENHERSQYFHDLNRMTEITHVLEHCIRSERFETHPEWTDTTIDLVICLRFLKKCLTEIHELSLEIDSEYSSGLFPVDHAAD